MKLLIKCFFVLLVISLVVACVSSRSFANDQTSKTVEEWIDETQEIAREDLDSRANTLEFVASFVDIVFSEVPWNYHLSKVSYKKLFRVFISRLDKEPSQAATNDSVYAWLASYAWKKEKFPNFGTLNKWKQGTITISVGWPDNPPNQNLSQADNKLVNSDPIKKIYPIVLDQVNKISNDIHEATGLSLKLNSLDGREDFTPGFGRIRIVEGGNLVDGKYSKKDPLEISDTHFLFSGTIPALEPNFWGGVSFTPDNLNQLEGYFLPDERNYIQASMCKISPNLAGAQLRAYITECIVRSLGVPDIFPDGKADSIVSDWARHDRYPDKLSAFDKKLLKALYCESLRNGMSRYDAASVLMNSQGKCFN